MQSTGSDAASDFPTIEDYVGNTPLVRVQRMGKHAGKNNTILLKLEGARAVA